MDIEYIKEFITMSEVCNYTLAADKLFVSQSALYKHIKALEEEIGVVLFVKRGKFVELTKYGKIFVPYAMQIVEMEQQFLMDVEESKQEENSVLVLGTGYRVTDLVSEFRKKYGDTCMIRERKGNDELMRPDTECELQMVCNLNPNQELYEAIPYINEELVVVLPKNHPLANRKAININEIKREKFVMIASYAEGMDMGTAYCIEHHVIPRVVMNGISGTEVAKLVAEGMGISILNRHSIERAMPGEVALVSLNPKVEFKVELCWRKDRKLSDMALKFIDFTEEYRKNFSENE